VQTAVQGMAAAEGQAPSGGVTGAATGTLPGVG
jgi:hypothetical protein